MALNDSGQQLLGAPRTEAHVFFNHLRRIRSRIGRSWQGLFAGVALAGAVSALAANPRGVAIENGTPIPHICVKRMENDRIILRCGPSEEARGLVADRRLVITTPHDGFAQGGVAQLRPSQLPDPTRGLNDSVTTGAFRPPVAQSRDNLSASLLFGQRADPFDQQLSQPVIPSSSGDDARSAQAPAPGVAQAGEPPALETGPWMVTALNPVDEVIAELDKLGDLEFALLKGGPHKGQVSLGVFSSPDNAERRSRQLLARGIQTKTYGLGAPLTTSSPNVETATGEPFTPAPRAVEPNQPPQEAELAVTPANNPVGQPAAPAANAIPAEMPATPASPTGTGLFLVAAIDRTAYSTIERLNALNDTNYGVRTWEPFKGHVSVGVFTSRDNAEQRAQALTEHGIATEIHNLVAPGSSSSPSVALATPVPAPIVPASTEQADLTPVSDAESPFAVQHVSARTTNTVVSAAAVETTRSVAAPVNKSRFQVAALAPASLAIEQLNALNDASFFLIKRGPLKGRVSLGVFSSTENAHRRSGELLEQGIANEIHNLDAPFVAPAAGPAFTTAPATSANIRAVTPVPTISSRFLVAALDAATPTIERMQELDDANFALLKHGSHQGRVSLGEFSSPGNAERRSTQMASLGVAAEVITISNVRRVAPAAQLSTTLPSLPTVGDVGQTPGEPPLVVPGTKRQNTPPASIQPPAPQPDTRIVTLFELPTGATHTSASSPTEVLLAKEEASDAGSTPSSATLVLTRQHAVSVEAPGSRQSPGKTPSAELRVQAHPDHTAGVMPVEPQTSQADPGLADSGINEFQVASIADSGVVINQLEAAGDTSYFRLLHGPFAGRMSLGVYQDRTNAERRKTDLAKVGIDAEIKVRMRLVRVAPGTSGGDPRARDPSLASTDR